MSYYGFLCITGTNFDDVSHLALPSASNDVVTQNSSRCDNNDNMMSLKSLSRIIQGKPI